MTKPTFCTKPRPCDWDADAAYCPHRECRQALISQLEKIEADYSFAMKVFGFRPDAAAIRIRELESQLISAEKRARLAEVKLEGEEAMRRELAESLHYANGASSHRDILPPFSPQVIRPLGAP